MLELGSTDMDLANKQGTPEWRAARNSRIGSSDIAVILGKSPYKTSRALWNEKTGKVAVKDISFLPHIKRGNEGETICRAILEALTNVEYEMPVLAHKTHPFLTASLDGIVMGKHLIEIKTMSDAAFKLASEKSVIPEHYLIQVQWQLMIAGELAPVGYFVPFRPESKEHARILVEPDAAMFKTMLEAALEFHEWMALDLPPPDPFENEEF